MTPLDKSKLLTATERAEKIVEQINEDCGHPCLPQYDLLHIIAAQIEEAQREVAECAKCHRANSFYCKECFAGELSSAEREAVAEAKALSCDKDCGKDYREGWNAAREKAVAFIKARCLGPVYTGEPKFSDMEWDQAILYIAGHIAKMKMEDK
jgi:hypothetical protein